MDTYHQDTKPAATSIATKASTPGAVSIDASSMKGQQAFRNAKALTGGPSYYPEDHQLQQLEQESAASKRAAGKSHDDKADEEWKQSGQAKNTTTESHAKAGASSVATGNSTPGAVHVDASSMQSHSKAAVPMTDEQLKRSTARKLRIASRTSLLSEDTKQEVEQDQDVDIVIPGAVQVSGIDSMDSTGDDPNDGLTMEDEDWYSTGGGDEEIGLQHKTTTTTIVEAQLVEENERELLDEEFRQKIIDEQMGQVAQAEVVEENDSKMRRRSLCWACSIVILLAIILGSVLGTRDTSSNAVPVLFPPLNNSLCGEALPIMLGGGAIGDSLENAIEQVVVFCEFPNQPSDSQRGLWYKVRG